MTAGDHTEHQPDHILGQLRQDFAAFAVEVCRNLPLYRRLCEGAAGDDEVLGLLAAVAPRQRRPNLLLAAVHDVLLSGVDHPLADWYGSVRPGAAERMDPAADPYPAFRDLCLNYPRVADLVATRTTQTNEVGRCGALVPALATVASSGAGRPLALIELGASAGLNLRFDSYSYDYGEGRRLGPESPVRLAPQSRGPLPVPVPPALPTVASRIGVDQDPVDVTDPDAARWLVACQWPDQLPRLERVRAALALAAADPPLVVAGDLLDRLEGLVADVPPGPTLCLYATWVLAYLGEEHQRELLAILDRLGAQRDLHLVYAEQPREIPGLELPPRPDGVHDDRFTALVWLSWRQGRRTAVRLADIHPHGTWLHWLHPTP